MYPFELARSNGENNKSLSLRNAQSGGPLAESSGMHLMGMHSKGDRSLSLVIVSNRPDS